MALTKTRLDWTGKGHNNKLNYIDDVLDAVFVLEELARDLGMPLSFTEFQVTWADN